MSGFEVRAAWIVGFALPLLEAIRRRTNFHPIFSYIDDFIAGGLLIWAAYLAKRRKANARAMLCAAWGILSLEDSITAFLAKLRPELQLMFLEYAAFT
jgi:hypothetical protein